MTDTLGTVGHFGFPGGNYFSNHEKGKCIFQLPHDEMKCVLSIKESYSTEGKRPRFSQMLMVRLGGVTPFPYGQPETMKYDFPNPYRGFENVCFLQDHVHFLEPSLKRSKDLHMYLNSKDRLIHQLTSAGVGVTY